jgi:hypothetical protein
MARMWTLVHRLMQDALNGEVHPHRCLHHCTRRTGSPAMLAVTENVSAGVEPLP